MTARGPLAIRAEMARRGLLAVQLGWYEDPDTERIIQPRNDPDTIAALWAFRAWLEAAVSGETP